MEVSGRTVKSGPWKSRRAHGSCRVGFLSRTLGHTGAWKGSLARWPGTGHTHAFWADAPPRCPAPAFLNPPGPGAESITPLR